MMTFFRNNKDAITSLGIIATFLISTISLWITLNNNKSARYIDTIVKNRVQWIYILQEKLSEYIALINPEYNVFYECKDDDEVEKMTAQITSCKILNNELNLLLDYYNPLNKSIIINCNFLLTLFIDFYKYSLQDETQGKILNSEYLKTYNNTVSEKLKETKKLLYIFNAVEWKKVRYESKGKFYGKMLQIFDINELDKRYDDNNYKTGYVAYWLANIRNKYEYVISALTGIYN